MLGWIKVYRQKPDPKHMAEAVEALSKASAFQDPDAAGVYVGFLAGVIGSSPGEADRTVGRIVKIKPEDHWVIVRAIAYSGHPEWRQLLAKYADRMPTRGAMIESYRTGKLPVLQQFGIREKPGLYQTVRNTVTFSKPPKEVMLEPSPVVLDTLWGYYFATGARWPIRDVLMVLPWATERNDVDRLTLGSTAKYGLANYAMRDPPLLAMIREERRQADDKAGPILDEVIAAAENVDIGQIRADAMAAINDLRAKGPAYKREIAWWGQAGQGVISLGCIAAAVTGQVQFGIPCVVGGSIASGILTYVGGQS